MTDRQPSHRYVDALDLIWTACARSLGFRLARSSEVYASSDGRGLIELAASEHLDPDDSLAQMVLHELCHALVEGAAGRAQPDWGLDNTSADDTWREHACLRLQAWLTLPWGLGQFFAPTTEHRVDFWMHLPEDDPFAAWPGESPWAEQARQAARRAAFEATQAPWHEALQRALAATRKVADALAASGAKELLPTAAGPDALPLPNLWSTVKDAPSRHPVSGLPLRPISTTADHGCRDCAWAYHQRGHLRCRRAPASLRVPEGSPACLGFEPPSALDCQRCAACCREAYDCVDVQAGERLVKKHPELVTERHGRRSLRREGGHCVALASDGPGCYRCTVYALRPRNCREFAAGGSHCLEARRRTGLSA
jgi:hypothetical protein